VALKVNLLPAKVNLLASAPSTTFHITTVDVSTPENTDKVIMLATNIDDLKHKTTFTITGGADVKKFTFAGNKLTFKATAFEARSRLCVGYGGRPSHEPKFGFDINTAFEARKDATYRVKIKATPDIFLWILLFSQTTEKTIVDWIPQTTEKTITGLQKPWL
jgi:hypothetical protein